MKMLIKLFAVIGVLATGYSLFSFIKSQTEASNYLKNCGKVKVGMNILEAKKIMGDANYWEKSTRSEIWMLFNRSDSTYEYMLAYPVVFGASTGTDTYFNTYTGKVTKVVCGE